MLNVDISIIYEYRIKVQNNNKLLTSATMQYHHCARFLLNQLKICNCKNQKTSKRACNEEPKKNKLTECGNERTTSTSTATTTAWEKKKAHTPEKNKIIADWIKLNRLLYIWYAACISIARTHKMVCQIFAASNALHNPFFFLSVFEIFIACKNVDDSG